MFPRGWGLFKWNYSGGRLGWLSRKKCVFLKNAGLVGGATGAPPGVCMPVFYLRFSIWGVGDLL